MEVKNKKRMAKKNGSARSEINKVIGQAMRRRKWERRACQIAQISKPKNAGSEKQPEAKIKKKQTEKG